MVSALLVLSLACNVSAAAAAENTTTTSNLTSYGADYLTKTDGSFWVWGGNRSVPTQIHDLNEVQAYFGSQYVMKKDLRSGNGEHRHTLKLLKCPPFKS